MTNVLASFKNQDKNGRKKKKTNMGGINKNKFTLTK